MSWVIFLPVAGLAALAGGSQDHREPHYDESPLVVVDPGHGGRNRGAKSAEPGVYEEEVTLAIAERVVGHLEARGVRAVLTRTGNDYLTLRERTRIANDHRADLFISVHANSSGRGNTRGYETHVLSVRGTTVDTPALRRHEGPKRPGVDADLARVLDSVEHAAAQEDAAKLAVEVQKELARLRGRRFSRGVRQDSHHVLLGANMPSVLVEVGFIDHPVEGPELSKGDVQDGIAKAIASAAARSLR